jgi:hypothetical protein
LQVLGCLLVLGLLASITLADEVVVDPASAIAPEVSAVPVPVPVAAPEQATSLSPGEGTITQHKNPDGSIVTITNFKGPIPSSAFQHFGKE